MARLFSQQSENYKMLLSKEILNISLFFKQELNVDMYLTFGTLLGAIREKDFINHDYDIDLAYVSNFTKRQDVSKEFDNICDILKKNNLFLVRQRMGQLHCKSLQNEMKFDIWTSYQVSETEINLIPIDFLIPINTILPLKQMLFRNVQINVPNNPEKLIDLLYKDWQTILLTDFRKFKF